MHTPSTGSLRLNLAPRRSQAGRSWAWWKQRSFEWTPRSFGSGVAPAPARTESAAVVAVPAGAHDPAPPCTGPTRRGPRTRPILRRSVHRPGLEPGRARSRLGRGVCQAPPVEGILELLFLRAGEREPEGRSAELAERGDSLLGRRFLHHEKQR